MNYLVFLCLVLISSLVNADANSQWTPSIPTSPMAAAKVIILRGSSRVENKIYEKHVVSQGPLEATNSTFESVLVQGPGHFENATIQRSVEGQGQLVLDQTVVNGDVKFSGALYIQNGSTINGEIKGSGMLVIKDTTGQDVTVKSSRVYLENVTLGKVYIRTTVGRSPTVYVKGASTIGQIIFSGSEGVVYASSPESLTGKVTGGTVKES